MSYLTSILLGIIQGITEFLPVSSSGHLVIAQNLIPGFSQPGILFDVILHFGTLAAVVYFFWSKIKSLSSKYLLFIIIGTIPAGAAGILFQKQFEAMFSGTTWVGLELIITGVLNLLVDAPVKRKVNLNPGNSFAIGIAQALAIIPGISRSGATIFTGVKLGIDRKKTAEYSFILSIPAILGANIVEITKYGTTDLQNSLTVYFAGFFASFVVGLASISVVLKFLLGGKFKIFGYYCLLIGFLALILL